ncbi:hypothetical protein [Photorhabdus bodei]|uniref:Uncharacterized protein n=1 Tax=Photorhabdus bodei TaxID=2029681 RepID=A0AAW6BIK1_9GAMM|nr:hypothetical protein [Photorhabdus bodei]MDB6371839.1 hypothetical protein [Photorhabdus bodei]
MFTFLLWDIDKYQSIRLIENYVGNEAFLVPTDQVQYPLLSGLTNCDEELYSNEEALEKLLAEVSELRKEMDNKEINDYLQQIASMIFEAINTRKSILITPFIE